MNKDLFHSLESNNIYFKPLSLNDIEDIHFYASDEDVKRFIGWSLMKDLSETKKHIETMMAREINGTHLYASVALKSNHKVIGTVMLFNFDTEANNAEVGYVFSKDYWNQGYGTESMSLINNFGFNSLKLHKLIARVTDANIGSSRILEKTGYTLEGNLKDHNFIDGQYFNLLMFGKINP